MKARKLRDGIWWVGAVDWDRRSFDALVPLPEGTSYNAWLVRGSERTALIDTVEPSFADALLGRLAELGVERLDYVVANHAEQDHSGCIPLVLERFPEAKVLATKRGKGMLCDLLPIDPDAIVEVGDGERVSLGDRALELIHFPWVHWPETMLTWLPEERVLFPCDLFGSHLATNELIASDEIELHLAAKLYYSQIMMPFRKQIQKRLPRVADLPIELIAPSHGPVHGRPSAIIEAYQSWVGDGLRDAVVLPYISMHASTRLLVDHLIEALTDRGVRVERFDLEATDIGKLAMALIDAATVVFGTPTVLGGPHPKVMYAAYLTAALQPKARWLSVVGSFGWGSRSADQIAETLSGLKMETLPPVMVRGTPRAAELEALDLLAAAIADRHATL